MYIIWFMKQPHKALWNIGEKTLIPFNNMSVLISRQKMLNIQFGKEGKLGILNIKCRQ